MSLSDIDRAHPAGKNRKQLIVRFTNYSARFQLYSARKKLKGRRDSVYINEDLTSNRFNLFRKMILLKQHKRISNCWSMDGRLFLTMDGQAGKKLITSDNDLSALGIVATEDDDVATAPEELPG